MHFEIVTMQTTSICNGKCSMCPYITSYYGNHPHKMDDALFYKIINDLKNHDTKKFCLYSLNEPYTDEKLEERLQYVSSNLPSSTLEISTNMTLCTSERAERTLNILSAHPQYNEIWISHHGINKDSFESIMGLDYERTLDNIVNLIRLNKGRVFIKIRGLGSSRDGKIRYFSPEDYFRYWANIASSYKLDFKNVSIDAYGTFHNRAGNVKLEGWDYDKDFGLHPDCYRLKNLHIDDGGLVVACCMTYEREEVYGDLNKQTIQEVYESEKYKTFYAKATGKIETDENFLCRKCMSPGG